MAAAFVLTLVVLGVALIRWIPITNLFYTDADTIREPVEGAAARDILWQPPTPLKDVINTQADDYEPKLSADGLTLYFVRGKAGGAADIYTSIRTPDGWTAPVEFDAVNTEFDELGPEPAPDGQALYFYSDRPGGSGGYDLWVAYRSAGKWQEPINLGPHVNSEFNDYGPALTPEADTLYFASNRPLAEDGQKPDPNAWAATLREDFPQRKYDLYTATITDGGFGNAEELSALNSPYNDGAPAVSSFGDFLYFSSDRPGGAGGFDLYRSRRFSDTHNTPQNLGPKINTARHELDPGLSLGGYALYFSSDRRFERQEPPAPQGSIASAPKKPDTEYNLFYTTSREVFEQQERLQRPPIDWAALWRAVGPNLAWALLALLLVLALLTLMRDAQGRRLSLLAKCLMASLTAHLMLMLLFNVWEVTASLAGEFRRHGRIQIALASPVAGNDLQHQIRGSMTDVDAPAIPSVTDERQMSNMEVQASAETAEVSVDRFVMDTKDRPSLELEQTDSSTEQQVDEPQIPEQMAESAKPMKFDTTLPAKPERSSVAEPTPEPHVDPESAEALARVPETEVVRRIGEVRPDAELTPAAQMEAMNAALLAKQSVAEQAPTTDADPNVTDPAALERSATAMNRSPIADLSLPKVAIYRMARANESRPVVDSTIEATPRSNAPQAASASLAINEQRDVKPEALPAAQADSTLAERPSRPDASADTIPSANAPVGPGPKAPLPLVGTLSLGEPQPAPRVAENSERPMVSSPVTELDTAELRSDVRDMGADAPSTVAVASFDPQELVRTESDDTLASIQDPTRKEPLPERNAGGPAQAMSVDASSSRLSDLPVPDVQPMEAHVATRAAEPEAVVERSVVLTPRSEVSQARSIEAPDQEFAPAHTLESTVDDAMLVQRPSGREADSRRVVARADMADRPRVSALPLSDLALSKLETAEQVASVLDEKREPRPVPQMASTEVRHDVTGTIGRRRAEAHIAPLKTQTVEPSSSDASLSASMIIPHADAAPQRSAGAPMMAVKVARAPASALDLALPTVEQQASETPTDTVLEVKPLGSEGIRAELMDGADVEMTPPQSVQMDVRVEQLEELEHHDELLASIAVHDSEWKPKDPLTNLFKLAPPPLMMPELTIPKLNLPSELKPPTDAYAQRSTPDRTALVERRGGSQETERAVAKALAWLAKHQSDDGHWDGAAFDETCGACGDETDIAVNNALTGLSLLAFLGAGHTHVGDSPYADNVRRAAYWLIDQQNDRGDLRGEETMYTHGIVTIALSEAYGMTGEEDFVDPVRRAVEFIDRARNRIIGGWRYDPGQAGDTSVLGWQIMALKSATMNRIPASADSFKEARRWMDLVDHESKSGLYAYRPGRRHAPAMTAEGMFVQQLLGMPRGDPRMKVSADFIARYPPNWDEGPNTYYWYYATLALFQYQGEHWRDWNRAITSELLRHQRRSGRAGGSWDPEGEWADVGGRVYQTALCTLMLEVYYRYLPMYSIEELVNPIGAIRGIVTDADTGAAIEGATVRLDLPDRSPISFTTGPDGSYALHAPEVPDFFALSASHSGYVPTTANVSSARVKGTTLSLDFELDPKSQEIVAIEPDPAVHHLGDDNFDGRINSQFQKKSEGSWYAAGFNLSVGQAPPNIASAQILLLAKGVQRRHRLRINGTVLETRLQDAPSNGSFGEYDIDFDRSLLRVGRNEFEIIAKPSSSDIDDFEFVNVRISISPKPDV